MCWRVAPWRAEILSLSPPLVSVALLPERDSPSTTTKTLSLHLPSGMERTPSEEVRTARKRPESSERYLSPAALLNCDLSVASSSVLSWVG